jgi:glycerate-2-kinase
MTKRINNWSEISNSRAREVALDIMEKGLEGADPYAAVLETLNRMQESLRMYKKVTVVGFGKGAYRMALACEKFFGGRLSAGAIIVPQSSVVENKLKRITVLEGKHPIPDEINVASSKKLLGLLKEFNTKELVVCLISGGGSALFTLPKEGIALEDVQAMTKLLLKAGANVKEINIVRKHLSAVSGGQLAKMIYPTQCLSLIMSDVVGNDIGSIASGPTSSDPSTYGDALEIMEKYKIAKDSPRNVIDHFKKGVANKVPETLKQGDAALEKTKNMVVANNMRSLSLMTRKAEELGLRATIISSRLEGEAREAGLMVGAIARQILEGSYQVAPPCAVIFGGETTVTVKGKGKGGRNQEFALSAATYLKGLENLAFASVGSDGIDGNTPDAGAIVDGGTIIRAMEKWLSPTKFLEENDSNTFLKTLGDCLISTGQTGTDVNDLAVLVML